MKQSYVTLIIMTIRELLRLVSVMALGIREREFRVLEFLIHTCYECVIRLWLLNTATGLEIQQWITETQSPRVHDVISRSQLETLSVDHDLEILIILILIYFNRKSNRLNSINFIKCEDHRYERIPVLWVDYCFHVGDDNQAGCKIW